MAIWNRRGHCSDDPTGWKAALPTVIGADATIGFPTANIDLHRRVSPLLGVYAVMVNGLGAEPRPGVANIGARPTVDGQGCRLEVHLFDFDQQIYGRHLEVEFRLKLRDEQRFESLDALKRQIQLDAATARDYLSGMSERAVSATLSAF